AQGQPGLPDGLLQATAGLTLRRPAEAIGSPERAHELLDGRIAYLQRQPAPAHRAEETATELALLHRARTALGVQLTGIVSLPFDGSTIARRVREVMANSRTDLAWRPPSAQERARRTQSPGQQTGTPGRRRPLCPATGQYHGPDTTTPTKRSPPAPRPVTTPGRRTLPAPLEAREFREIEGSSLGTRGSGVLISGRGPLGWL
uniref:hypothetical protein n=1 Tax=Streptomyces viridosporus TaxID=67581 RepID=UPI001C3F8430